MLSRTLLAMSSLAVAALAEPNFSGTWTLNHAESVLGRMPAPESLTRVIHHTDPTLAISTTQSGPRGELTTHLLYTTDGKESTNSTAAGPIRGIALWEGDELVIRYAMPSETAGDIQAEDRWRLSQDGTKTTVATRLRGSFGSLEQTLVFDRQQ
jgi:hypothetical protein